MVARTEQLGSPRILAGVAGSIEVLVYQDGTLTDPDASPATLTCAVVDAHGRAVSSGNATRVGGSSGKVRYDLTAAEIPDPVLLTATWSFVVGGAARSVTTAHEVVGELLFTVAEARAYDDATLASSATYSDDAILRARDRILDAFTDVCGRSFGTRYARVTLDGTGRAELDIPTGAMVSAVRSISERASGGTTLTAYTVAELADVLVYPNGLLVRETLGTFLVGRRNVIVEYEHGLAPLPLEIREAALRLLRDQIVPSNLPDRATSQSNEFGAFSLATAGMRGAWFGIPRVDAVLDRYRRRLPGVA